VFELPSSASAAAMPSAHVASSVTPPAHTSAGTHVSHGCWAVRVLAGGSALDHQATEYRHSH